MSFINKLTKDKSIEALNLLALEKLDNNELDVAEKIFKYNAKKGPSVQTELYQ